GGYAGAGAHATAGRGALRVQPGACGGGGSGAPGGVPPWSGAPGQVPGRIGGGTGVVGSLPGWGCCRSWPGRSSGVTPGPVAGCSVICSSGGRVGGGGVHSC